MPQAQDFSSGVQFPSEFDTQSAVFSQSDPMQLAAFSQSVGSVPAPMMPHLGPMINPFAPMNNLLAPMMPPLMTQMAFEKHPSELPMRTQFVKFPGGPQFVIPSELPVLPQPPFVIPSELPVLPQPPTTHPVQQLPQKAMPFEMPAEHAGFANIMRLQQADPVFQLQKPSMPYATQHQDLAHGDSQSEDDAEVSYCSASESGASSDPRSGRGPARRNNRRRKKRRKKPVPSYLEIVKQVPELSEPLLSGNQAALVDNTVPTIVFQKQWARSNRIDFGSKHPFTVIKEEGAPSLDCLMKISGEENDATFRMSFVDPEEAATIGFRVGMKIHKFEAREELQDDCMKQIEDTIKERNIDFEKNGALRARSHQFCIEANFHSLESIMFGGRAFKAIMEAGVKIDKIADAPRKKGRRYFVLVPNEQSVDEIRRILMENPVLEECVSQHFNYENKLYSYSRVAQKLHNQAKDIKARGFLKHEFFDTLDAARKIFPKFGTTVQSVKHYEERMIIASNGRNPADKQVVQDAINAFEMVEEFLRKIESTRPSTA